MSTRPSGAGAFVGREAEIATLATWLELVARAAPPRAGTALVAGEPGIGKSRLVAELADRARTDGWRVVWGRSWDEVDAPPYWPWTQVVRSLLGSTRGTDLGALVLDDPDDADRFELFDATADRLRSAATDRPLLVVLEDLHAADHVTLRLARFVAQQLRSLPVAVLGTYRPTEARARPDVAEQLAALSGDALEVALTGLDLSAVAALVGDAARAPDVLAATGGNPLFVEQVRRTGTDGATPDRGGADTTAALRAAIAARVAQLDSGVVRAMLAISVAGHPASAEDVASLVDDDPAPIRARLDRAVAAGLAAQREKRFEAVHSLVAEMVVAGADAIEVGELHHRIAATIGDDPGRAGERAHHLLRAGPAHRSASVAACRRAADLAAAALAHEEAVSHLDRALGVLDDVPGADAERLELLLAKAGAQWRTEDRRGAEASYEQALTLAVACGDAEARALAALRGGIQYWFDGAHAEALAEDCRGALEALPEGDHPLRARLLAEVAAKSIAGPLGPSGRRLAAEALAMAHRTGDDIALGRALVAEQVTDLGPATLSRRLTTAPQVLALARRTGEPSFALHGRFLLMGALLELGDIRALDAELVRQRAVIDDLADPNLPRFTRWFQCTRAMLDGRPDHAERLAEQCLELAGAAGDPDGVAVYGGQLGIVRWMQDRLIEMEPVFELQRRENPGDPLWSAVLAYVWATNGRLDAARGALAAMVEAGDVPEGMHWLLTMVASAEAAVAVGDTALVADRWEQLLPYADRFVPVGMGAAVWGSVARPLGLAALHLDHVEEGLVHLQRAVDGCARLGARPWLVEAQIDLATALLSVGRDDDPRLSSLVGEALATGRQLGLDHFVDKAEALRRAMGAAPAVTDDGAHRVAGHERARPAIAVLGAFEVTSSDGRVATWTSRKARELLKILVARRGAPVHREVLMDLLWPGRDPAELGNRLSVALSTVRRALDPDRQLATNELVAADRSAVRLCTDRIEVDVERFLDRARAALAAEDPAHAHTTSALVEAARLHRGPPLPDEPYADWASPLQGEVRDVHLRVVRALAERARSTGDDLAASDAFRRLVEADPFDEEVHREFVDALERVGAAGGADLERRRFRQLALTDHTPAGP